MQVETNTTENVSEMGTEQELLSYLSSEDVKDTITKDDVTTTQETLDNELPVIGEEGLITKSTETKTDEVETKTDDADTKTDDAGDGNETEQEFSNIVEYINSTHDLGMNLEELPEDLTREQEAEIISDLLEKVATSATGQVENFKEISQVLEDKEVAAFIEAKRQGATLRDFVEALKDEPTTMSDEDIMRLDTKNRYPNMTDEEVESSIEEFKTKGFLNKMAGSVRERMIAQETARKEADVQQSQATYQKDVNELGQMLEGTSAVYGVPLTDDIKKNVFTAATKRNEKGLTYLDEALQSNEGVILATLGLLHMQDLMKANSSVNTNRRNRNLVDKLFESPTDLQSNSQDGSDKQTFNPNVANSF